MGFQQHRQGASSFNSNVFSALDPRKKEQFLAPQWWPQGFSQDGVPGAVS